MFLCYWPQVPLINSCTFNTRTKRVRLWHFSPVIIDKWHGIMAFLTCQFWQMAWDYGISHLSILTNGMRLWHSSSVNLNISHLSILTKGIRLCHFWPVNQNSSPVNLDKWHEIMAFLVSCHGFMWREGLVTHWTAEHLLNPLGNHGNGGMFRGATTPTFYMTHLVIHCVKCRLNVKFHFFYNHCFQIVHNT